MANTAITKQKSSVKQSQKADVGVDALTKTSISVMAGVSALIGLWAVACFVGGMISSGGPLSFIADWFRSITGM
jgi:hypothetical protein